MATGPSQSKRLPITRQELSAKVLAAIREHPKCGLVKEIAVTPEVILDVQTQAVVSCRADLKFFRVKPQVR